MKFIEVAKVFDHLEAISSRLTITKVLADLLKKATANQASIIAYLSLGELNPTYIGTQFNFAEKSMLKVLVKFLNKGEQSIKSAVHKFGDLGLVIQNIASDLTIAEENQLTLVQVARELKEFLDISGEGAVSAKEEKLLNLLNKLEPLSAKYIVRIILGKLRLGFSDMTLLDAFSWMLVDNKSLRPDLEDAYNVCVDIGMIVKILKESGVAGVKKISIIPGIPIRPAAAERLASAQAIVKKLGKCVAQPKLDGFRLQVHIDNRKNTSKIHFFSRNLQDMSDMFPDLKSAVLQFDVDTLVAEGEAIAFNMQTGTFLPFQETVKRKRKYDIEKISEDFPLKLYLFDILYLNGKSLLDKSHDERRKLLCSIFDDKRIAKQEKIFLIEQVEIKTSDELENYFHQNIEQGLEGVVVKKRDAVYMAGKRNFNWIKLKREESGQLVDTIDCVILGYYAGKGKRASFGIGALLVGVFNKSGDVFQTVAKIGTGFTDEEWKNAKRQCDKIKVLVKPKNVECAKELYPDVWVDPEIVCAILADEITLSPLHSAGQTEKEQGYALRFPRFVSYRPDKSALESTTVHELKELYGLQFESKGKKGIKKSSKKNKKDTITLNIF